MERELLAINLYRREVLTLSQAAALANMTLHDFIDVCSRLHIPILWEPEGQIGAEVDAFSAMLEKARRAE